MSDASVKEGFVKGSLTQVPFPKVLNFVNLAGKSGILALSQGKRKVHIHFDRGEIVYVTSSYFPEMLLGEYLVNEGLIGKEVHEESIEVVRAEKVKLGAYLVEKGHLSPHDLYDALNMQVSKKLFKMFAWTEGDFFFREGEIIGEEHRILNISFPNLLYRGIRFYMPLTKPPQGFRGRKEDVLVKRLAGRYRIEDLQLGPADVRVFNLLNGERTLRQIIAASNMSKRSAYKVLYALFLLELVGFPEAYRSDRITTEKKKKKQAREKKKGAGFEIQVSNDLIAEAMASVDRIRQESETDVQFGDFQPSDSMQSAQQMAGLSHSGRGAADPAAEFLSKVDASLADAPETSSEDFLTGEQRRTAPAPPEESADDYGLAAAAPDTDPFATLGGGSDFGDVDLGEAADLGDGGVSVDDYGLDNDGDFDTEQEASGGGLLMDVDDFSNPEDLVKQAGYLLDDSNWEEARRFLQKAIEIDENNCDAYALLGWAMFNANPHDSDNVREAEGAIKNGMKINPNRYLHFLYLGKIYAATEQFEFAELHFVKALELNVECSEAKEEIKRIHNR
ncbi:MAG: DUF4388 domain-containing protein [Candidatus Lernaella stagnicola]|nr:DUF4388 domain-containing protein [Candidatus Lernaella stagnicola]